MLLLKSLFGDIYLKQTDLKKSSLNFDSLVFCEREAKNLDVFVPGVVSSTM